MPIYCNDVIAKICGKRQYIAMRMLTSLMVAGAALLSAALFLQPAIAASAFQNDPAHSGTVSFKNGFPPPLRQLWVKDLKGPISYPIIEHGVVFVTVGNAVDDGARIYALDLASGKILWQVNWFGTDRWANLAYDAGRLFVLNSNGLLASLKPANGKIEWIDSFPSYFFSAPTAGGGILYLDTDLALAAIDEQSGAFRWIASINGEDSTPTVGQGGVYVSFVCQVYKFDPTTGNQLWNFQGGCDGGGGWTAVLDRSRLYARNSNADFPHNLILSTSSGSELGSFSADYTPPVIRHDRNTGHSYVISLFGGTLTSYKLGSGKAVWSFSGDGGLVSAPLIVNGQVAIGSLSGEFYLLDGATGVVTWSTNVGAPFVSPDENDVNQPLPGLGAGENVLIVPTSHLLAAYVSTPGAVGH